MIMHNEISADLLVVGGNESAWAAAVQALRLNVGSVVLVSDGVWLGGQFSSEAVGPVDERIVLDGNSLNFPRSGLALEVVEAIRGENSRLYGYPMPGLSWSATDTVEPRVAARLFETMLDREVAASSSKFIWIKNAVPHSVDLSGNRVTGVRFLSADGDIQVTAKLTIDSSDWGDVVKLSGAASFAGPDPRERFGEPSAPVLAELDVQEMNPLTWTVTLRRASRPASIPRPHRYDRRRYLSVTRDRAFKETALVDGPYGYGGSVFTSRRLIDTVHLDIDDSRACIQLNWAVQDYPLSQLPDHVVKDIEAVAPGGSALNMADMPPSARNVIFADARAHALGFLYYLQTETEILGEDIVAIYRSYELTDEFGTVDRLPPKPYLREGRRLAACAVLTENDVKATDGRPAWGNPVPSDGVLGFQFHIDFHPTRRHFPDGEAEALSWLPRHTPTRNWDAHTDRAILPARSFVPERMEGLVGAGKTIGVSSIVQAALRLHCQMLLVGQIAGTIAALALRSSVSPRELVTQPGYVRRLQLSLLRGVGGPPVHIWPWQDLHPASPSFEAVSMLTLEGIWPYEREDLYLHPDDVADDSFVRETLRRLDLAAGGDVARSRSGTWERKEVTIVPTTWGDLARLIRECGREPAPGLDVFPDRKLLRADLSRFVYAMWQTQHEDCLALTQS